MVFHAFRAASLCLDATGPPSDTAVCPTYSVLSPKGWRQSSCLMALEYR